MTKKRETRMVGFFCDLNPTSGLGHIMRCKLLHDAFVSLGNSCIFLVGDYEHNLFLQHLEGRDTYVIGDGTKCLSTSVVNAVETLEIGTIVFDTYKTLFALEGKLRELGVFIASIDDHWVRHDSNLVFSNRSVYPSQGVENPRGARWFSGNKYILVPKISRYKPRYQNNIDGKVNILVHAGGSSAYHAIAPLIDATFHAFEQKPCKIDIICSNEASIEFVRQMLSKYSISGKVHLIPAVKKLANRLREYDFVVGPGGTTTFEALASGVICVSVPLNDDGRDAPECWPFVGHLLHLAHDEALNKEVLIELWSFAMKNRKRLSEYVLKYGATVDGQGPMRVAKVIDEHRKNNFKINPEVEGQQSVGAETDVIECDITHSRLYLQARNQDFVRENSSHPAHKISWPEHLSWWFGSDTKRFALRQDQRIKAFFWDRVVRDEFGEFVISGWMPVPEIANKFEIGALAVKHQIKHLKEACKGKLWVISMQRHNKVAEFLNIRNGFVIASLQSEKRAAKVFGIDSANFKFMEMQL